MAQDIAESQLPYTTSPNANTVELFSYVGRGVIDHALSDSDGAGNTFLAVALPNEDNPNYTFANVYRRAPGEAWPGTQIGTLVPVWKIDSVEIGHDGTTLVVSATTHQPKEAPRFGKVEALMIPNVWTPVVAQPPVEERGGPCGPSGLPYFRPGNKVTRGQLAKMLVLSSHMPINTAGGPHFQDVPEGSTFYDFVETVFNAGIAGGYPCNP